MNGLSGYDVVIIGGGPGGIGAAITAGRSGAKALLIEREGCLGGGATVMMVNPFMPCTTYPPDEKTPRKVANAGVFMEVMRRLRQKNGGYLAEYGTGYFDDEILKIVYDELLAEAGATVLFHTTLFDAQVENGFVRAVRLSHNGGPISVAAKVFIDATGDALLAQQAGCEIMFGDDSGKVMPMTLFFALADVDKQKMPTLWEFSKMCAKGANDTPALLNTNFSCYAFGPNGLLYINAIRLPGNTLDPFDISRAEAEGRRRAHNFTAWMRANVPGCANAKLVKTGSHVGIRESRRVLGDYLLCNADFDRCARFDDAIACCTYPVDIHGQAQGQTTMKHLPPNEFYQIPYRCLTPKGCRNLLVASRSISSDVTMHSSLRVMPPVMSIGEAAGYAAAMSLPEGDVRKIGVKKLQQKIVANGGALEPLEMKMLNAEC